MPLVISLDGASAILEGMKIDRLGIFGWERVEWDPRPCYDAK